MYDKKFTTLLVILIIITGWTLSQTFSISQNMEMVKEKFRKWANNLTKQYGTLYPKLKKRKNKK
jgi:GH18 family chitinase